MKHKHNAKLIKEKPALVVVDRPFPRPICLEKYENDILKTLKAFSNKDAYYRKTPHKLEGKDGLYSIDVKSRNDKYRMLFYVDNRICKITNLCTEETH